MRKATVTVHTGDRWTDITGNIVHIPASGSGVTIEDKRGIRWFAFNNRVVIHAGTDAGPAMLW